MKHPKSCLVVSVAFILCLLGSTLLLVFGLMFLKPYMTMRHLSRSVCYLNPHSGSWSYIPCTCTSVGEDCLSYFPCVHMLVNVTMQNGDIVSNVTFYDQLGTYQQMHSTRKCSFYYCDPIIHRNSIAIQSYLKKYSKIGTQKFCYHDNKHPDYAVEEVITKTTVLHSILWPALCLVLGIIILTLLIFKIPLCIQKRILEHNGTNMTNINLFGYQLMKHSTV